MKDQSKGANIKPCRSYGEEESFCFIYQRREKQIHCAEGKVLQKWFFIAGDLAEVILILLPLYLTINVIVFYYNLPPLQLFLIHVQIVSMQDTTQLSVTEYT